MESNEDAESQGETHSLYILCTLIQCGVGVPSLDEMEPKAESPLSAEVGHWLGYESAGNLNKLMIDANGPKKMRAQCI
jgi:hypothetical protein